MIKQGVKYVQKSRYQNASNDIVLVSLLLNLRIFHNLFFVVIVDFVNVSAR